MIALLDTSTPMCRLTLVIAEKSYDYEWQADRSLARGLLAFLRDKLKEHSATFNDISGIGVMKGPGSFTGLRIGITVMNTIASAQQIPIVGVTADEQWQEVALTWLQKDENDELVMPEYGASANITTPRK